MPGRRSLAPWNSGGDAFLLPPPVSPACRRPRDAVGELVKESPVAVKAAWELTRPRWGKVYVVRGWNGQFFWAAFEARAHRRWAPRSGQSPWWVPPALAAAGWLGASAAAAWLKGPCQDGSGAEFPGGCQFKRWFPAGSAIPLCTPYFEGRSWVGLNLPFWWRSGWGRGVCFRELELAVLPVCESRS